MATVNPVPMEKARAAGSANRVEAPQPPPKLPQPWRLPAQGLALFHGPGETARLSHYFFPRLLQAGKNILMLDGANAADPRLLERLARARGVEFSEFSRRIRIARAFTCFQLTELVARVPRLLADFPAQVLVITALPDLYFDQDIRDGDARGAFERALRDLRRWVGERSAAPGRLAAALFSSAGTFTPSPARRHFFARVRAAATEVWRFSLDEDGRPKLFLERVPAAKAGSNREDALRVLRASKALTQSTRSASVNSVLRLWSAEGTENVPTGREG